MPNTTPINAEIEKASRGATGVTMVVIPQNAEITKGYETWKNLFLSVDHVRKKYGIKVLAYGHPKENEGKVYQVLEVPSMETMQDALKDQDLAKLRTDAGVNLDSQEVVFLVE